MSLSIALVTPSLNQAIFLKEAVDSVLSQKVSALDYIVIDGGSSDGAQEVMKSYGSRLKWLSEPDAGQSAAINKGWRLVQGDIVGWLNSDDRLEPGALAQVQEFFENHPEIDLVYGNCDLINTSGKVTGKYPVQPFDYTRLVVQAANYIPQPATFFRQSLLTLLGGLDESLHFGMDYDYWLRAGLNHPVAYLPSRLAALRLHGGAKSIAQMGRFASENVRIFQRLLQRADLPAQVRQKRNQALSNVFHRAADNSFWAGALAQARDFAWQSWLYQPLRPRSLWLWLLMGRSGRRWAEKLYGNPYL